MRETERCRQRPRQREKQAPCGEPEVGLDPRTPGSRPGPKADAQPLSHPGVPISRIKHLSCNLPGFSLEKNLPTQIWPKPGPSR